MMLGDVKVNRAYAGDVKIYSSSNIVTYHVDTGITYVEEVDEGESCLAPKTFTPAKGGREFVGWRQDTAANADVLNSLVMGDAPVTLYAVFQQIVTVTFYNDSESPSYASAPRYYNNGNVVNPKFTLTQHDNPYWAERGWSTTNRGDAAITYANGATFTRDSDITLYGLYQHHITVTYYNGSTSASTSTKVRYWAPAGAIDPSFALSQTGLSGWTARGWSTSTAASGGITYSNGETFTRDSNVTLYGMYYQDITLSYNGNGATSGSMAAQHGTRYYNSNGNTTNPAFVLQANGFSKTTYSFSKWALNGTDGTQYAVGATVTLGANTTMYAVWVYVSNPFYVIQNYERVPGTALSFDFVSGYNVSGITHYGSNWAKVFGEYEDENDSTEFVARSNSINTNGNSYVRVRAHFTKRGYIRVNGQTLDVSDVTKDFDISGLSSIQLDIGANIDSGSPYVTFAEIYFH